MDFSQVLTERKSCRKYKDKAVPDELIGAVVEAGAMAPSSGDKQNWKFIVVRNKEKREQIAKFSMEQYWMADAPAFIVICSDDSLVDKIYGSMGETYSIQNCAIAGYTMNLAATDLGLSSCFVSGIDRDEIAEILGVPGSSTVQAIITLGYGAGKEVSKRSKRALKEVMNIESYGSDGKDLSTFLFDWSNVLNNQISALTDDVVGIVKKELGDASKTTKKTWEDVSKKIQKWMNRKL